MTVKSTQKGVLIDITHATPSAAAAAAAACPHTSEDAALDIISSKGALHVHR